MSRLGRLWRSPKKQVFDQTGKVRGKVVKPKNQIEELNEWLFELILSKEVMARVMKSDDLTVEFNEEGVPI